MAFKLGRPRRASLRLDQPCGCFFIPSERIIVPVCPDGLRIFHDAAAHRFVEDAARFQLVLDHFAITREMV